MSVCLRSFSVCSSSMGYVFLLPIQLDGVVSVLANTATKQSGPWGAGAEHWRSSASNRFKPVLKAAEKKLLTAASCQPDSAFRASGCLQGPGPEQFIEYILEIFSFSRMYTFSEKSLYQGSCHDATVVVHKEEGETCPTICDSTRVSKGGPVLLPTLDHHPIQVENTEQLPWPEHNHPWFEAWQQLFIRSFPNNGHEMKEKLACSDWTWAAWPLGMAGGKFRERGAYWSKRCSWPARHLPPGLLNEERYVLWEGMDEERPTDGNLCSSGACQCCRSSSSSSSGCSSSSGTCPMTRGQPLFLPPSSM